METEKIFFNRTDHSNLLLKEFRSYLENETLADCTLAAEGKYLKAHQIILSACSAYFKSLFKDYHDGHPVIVFKGIQFQHLKAIVDFMYYGAVHLDKEHIKSFMYTTIPLRIDGLTKIKDILETKGILEKDCGTAIHIEVFSSQDKPDFLFEMENEYNEHIKKPLRVDILSRNMTQLPLTGVITSQRTNIIRLPSKCKRHGRRSVLIPLKQLASEPVMAEMNKHEFRKQFRSSEVNITGQNKQSTGNVSSIFPIRRSMSSSSTVKGLEQELCHMLQRTDKASCGVLTTNKSTAPLSDATVLALTKAFQQLTMQDTNNNSESNNNKDIKEVFLPEKYVYDDINGKKIDQINNKSDQKKSVLITEMNNNSSQIPAIYQIQSSSNIKPLWMREDIPISSKFTPNISLPDDVHTNENTKPVWITDYEVSELSSKVVLVSSKLEPAISIPDENMLGEETKEVVETHWVKKVNILKLCNQYSQISKKCSPSTCISDEFISESLKDECSENVWMREVYISDPSSQANIDASESTPTVIDAITNAYVQQCQETLWMPDDNTDNLSDQLLYSTEKYLKITPRQDTPCISDPNHQDVPISSGLTPTMSTPEDMHTESKQRPHSYRLQELHNISITKSEDGIALKKCNNTQHLKSYWIVEANIADPNIQDVPQSAGLTPTVSMPEDSIDYIQQQCLKTITQREDNTKTDTTSNIICNSAGLNTTFTEYSRINNQCTEAIWVTNMKSDSSNSDESDNEYEFLHCWECGRLFEGKCVIESNCEKVPQLFLCPYCKLKFNRDGSVPNITQLLNDTDQNGANVPQGSSNQNNAGTSSGTSQSNLKSFLCEKCGRLYQWTHNYYSEGGRQFKCPACNREIKSENTRKFLLRFYRQDPS